MTRPDQREPAQGEAASPSRGVPRKITATYLERAAKFHLERYASSAENLRRILSRKVHRRCRLRGDDPAEFKALVEETLAKALRSGLVDDERYAEGQVATLRRRGGSSRLIGARLAAKGVGPQVIAKTLLADGGAEASERAAAWAFARRRRLGPYRIGDRAERREKDLAALARAGFRFDIVRDVIDGEVGNE